MARCSDFEEIFLFACQPHDEISKDSSYTKAVKNFSYILPQPSQTDADIVWNIIELLAVKGYGAIISEVIWVNSEKNINAGDLPEVVKSQHILRGIFVVRAKDHARRVVT